MAKIDDLDSLAVQVEGVNLESNRLGSGAYGVVYSVSVRGRQCIAKKLHNALHPADIDIEQRLALEARFRQECHVLSTLNHQNIVQFVGVHYGHNKSDLSLVMERLHIDLSDFVEKNPTTSLSVRLSILHDVSCGLLYLHTLSPPLIHRDLTAPNIFLTEDATQAKIGDMGVARYINPNVANTLTTGPGNIVYMPPEAFDKHPVYTIKLDIFSYGNLIVHTINGKMPEVYRLAENDRRQCSDRGQEELMRREEAILVRMGTNHCVYPLVVCCLHDNPDRRPTTQEVNTSLQDLCERCLKECTSTEKEMAEIEIPVRLSNAVSSCDSGQTMESAALKQNLIIDHTYSLSTLEEIVSGNEDKPELCDGMEQPATTECDLIPTLQHFRTMGATRMDQTLSLLDETDVSPKEKRELRDSIAHGFSVRSKFARIPGRLMYTIVEGNSEQLSELERTCYVPRETSMDTYSLDFVQDHFDEEDKSECRGPEEQSREWCTLVLGRTGVGKSTLVNGIVGEKLFEESHMRHQHVRTKIGVETVKKQVGSQPYVMELKVVDTSAFHELNVDSEMDEAVITVIKETCEKPDLLIYCIDMRETRHHQHEHAIQKITSCLGVKIWKHSIFVLTFANIVATSRCSTEKEFKQVVISWEKKGKDILKRNKVPKSAASKIQFVPAGIASTSGLPGIPYWFSELWGSAVESSSEQAHSTLMEISFPRFLLITSFDNQADHWNKSLHDQQLIVIIGTTSAPVASTATVIGGLVVGGLLGGVIGIAATVAVLGVLRRSAGKDRGLTALYSKHVRATNRHPVVKVLRSDD